MNKLLLGSAAIVALTLASAPAQAQMELTIGGHSKNYIGFVDQDDAAGSETRDFDMQRETELHFNGESTLDNGLTFGFQVETEVDGGDGSSFDTDNNGDLDSSSDIIEESYIYMSGTWGRVNLGSEDGAAYLLQVAAPSADANIDGIRQYINPVNYGNINNVAAAITASSANGAPAGTTGDVDGFDYDQDITGTAEKITYLTPNFNGFQLGASYTPDLGDTNSVGNITNGFNDDNTADSLGEAYEAGIRYEGVMSNFGYAVGAGYTHAENENTTAREGDYDAFNVGLDIDVGAFGIGAAYVDEEQEHRVVPNADADVQTYVVGVDYTTGAFKFGASYYNQDDETVGANELETQRYTGGVVYTAGPGLSFRGSVSQIDHEVGSADADATSFLGGVQINF